MLGLLLAATLTITGGVNALSSGTSDLHFRIDGPATAPLRLHFSQYVDRVEARIPLANGTVVTELAGTSVPFWQRTVRTIDPVLPIPAGVTYPVTIDASVHAEDRRFAIPTLETNYPENPTSEPDAFYILTVGLLLGIALYHLVLYGALRDRNIGLYVVYLAAFILYEFTASGLAWRYLWPFASIPSIAALRVAAFIVALAVMLFARSFMQTAKNARIADGVFVGAIGLTGVATLIGILFPPTLAVAAIVADVGLLLGIVALTVTAALCVRRGVRSAGFFLIGFSGLFIGAIIKIVVDDLGSISSTAHFYGIELGVSFDAIVLALGLADRMRLQERLARTDALTGVANRRMFDERLKAEWSRSGRYNKPLAVLMVDIDRFKPYNDALGHLAGDACLRTIANAANAAVQRADEIFARYGGEEFAVILPDTNPASAMAVAERIRGAVEALAVPHPDGGLLTVSVGVEWTTGVPHVEASASVAHADDAMYRAKARGGNCVESSIIDP